MLVSYFVLTAPPPHPGQPPLDGIQLRRERPANDVYLDLYRAIGGPLGWDLRTAMRPDDLRAFLDAPTSALFVLRRQRDAVGLCEFDGIGQDEVELVHFGIVAALRGRGLGRWFLAMALNRIWRHAPGHVWLHTDAQDSPAAVPLYTSLGFRLEGQREEPLDRIGLLPPPWRDPLRSARTG
jgi:ribosomal protein S18 acetylase RimI-like enzyme